LLTSLKSIGRTTNTVKYNSEETERQKLNYYSSLLEKQRRHFLALEYLKLRLGSSAIWQNYLVAYVKRL